MAYPGGKNGTGVYQKIINHMPPHATYIEPFLGGGAILRLKKPAISSLGIDADGEVISQWRVLRSVPPNLTLLQADALDWLANHTFSSDTLIYADPPYLMSTRSSQRPIYRYELTDEQHARLLSIVVRLSCQVMISGYWSEMYADALRDWRSVSFTTRTRGGGSATEWLWMNFPKPFTLHDYRYLGENFRERERIRRKIGRWKSRLLTMSDLERNAMFAALDEIRAAPGHNVVSGDARPSPQAAVSPAAAIV